jgi:hypothetical protein
MRMKRFATGLTLMSLIAISVLGFFAMHNMHGTQCITETATRAACPENDVFAAIGFHVQAWQDISAASLEQAATGAGLIFLAFVLAFAALAAFVAAGSEAVLLVRRVHLLVPVPSRAAELRWLAFHSNSPNSA